MEGKTILCILTVLLLIGNCAHAERSCKLHQGQPMTWCINELCTKDCNKDYQERRVKKAYCTGIYPFTKVYCVCNVCD
ncbi:hypothetical protein ZWY2020_010879 [Hordeum vulgare]|nr:hypothetical protein ZWY2020_051229 [Hordeum vulgare]KAI5000919.1 hypothetical protein ZWY2020_010878 [Hordeum vulgare]KAI5000920.1 hypothetical protein ZWY2020_010879 [Hordeum vulgare]